MVRLFLTVVTGAALCWWLWSKNSAPQRDRTVLHIGLFQAPGYLSVASAAKLVEPKIHVAFHPDECARTLLDGDADAIVLPLSYASLGRRFVDPEKWRIIWAPFRSRGSDRVLIRSEFAGEDLRTVLGHGRIATVEGTFSTRLLRSYLSDNLGPAAAQDVWRSNRQDFLRASDLFREVARSNSSFSLVSVHDPWAFELTSHGFVEVNGPAHRELSCRYVLLARTGSLELHIGGSAPAPTVKSGLLHVIELLDESYAEFERDMVHPETGKLSNSHPNSGATPKSEALTAFNFDHLSLAPNIIFLFGSDENCRTDVLATLGDDDFATAICDSRDPSFIRLRLQQEMPLRKLGSDEQKAICSSALSATLTADISRFSVGDPRPPHEPWRVHDAGSMSLASGIGQLGLLDEETYCVVGFADASGKEVKNLELSHARAENIYKQLEKAYPKSKFLVDWRGSAAAQTETGEDRRVEIRKVTLQ